MTRWQSGDIITDKRWDELNNVYPLYKKIEIAADSLNNNLNNNVIFDIQMSELQDLIDHHVMCWCKDGNNNIVCINVYNNIEPYNINDTRAAILWYE